MFTEVSEKLRNFFKKREEVQFAIIFGSLAKGTTNALSDIDIAVMIDPSFKDTTPYGYNATLTSDLMQELKRNDVDVVILNKARIMLRYEILRHGKFIYIRDKQARIQFQINTINQYEDFKAIYRIHKETSQQRWKELIASKIE
jgi:predicted nucleotidyltransferase